MALGPEKRKLATWTIAGPPSQRFAPGGLVSSYYGQGKWYPGEPLPRWALACYWRTDGAPLWRDRELLAREENEYQFGVPDAALFAQTLARRLGLDPAYVRPAFEDSFHHLQQERQLPVNVEAADNHLEDPLERERIRRVSERGLQTPVGLVLPLQREPGLSGREWQTGVWPLRGEHLFLVPGDSPVGLRYRWRVCLGWIPRTRPRFIRSICRCSRGPLPIPARECSRSLRRRYDRESPPSATACLGAGRIRAVDCPQGAVRRTPRRPPPHLHAAGRSGRGLRRPPCRS